MQNKQDKITPKPTPLHALAAQRILIGWIVLFGIFVNLLFLTGPIFALQVYDRVLNSRSVETLVALTILMAFLFLIMGLLDHARRRIAARIGERINSILEEPVFDAMLRQQSRQDTGPLDDLEVIRRFFASALFVALFDLPWMPVFMIAIAFFHPALGWLALSGAVVIMLPLLSSLIFGRLSKPPERGEDQTAEKWAQIATSGHSVTFGLDRKGPVFRRWQAFRRVNAQNALGQADRSAAAASITQTFRLFLQSAIIALGAYFVLQGSLTAGAIIATSVLLWRALAPLDMVSQNAATLRQMQLAWRRLTKHLAPDPNRAETMPLSAGKHGLRVDRLTVFAPGIRQAAIRLVTFELDTGQAIGVTGASGSGKSTLAKALIGQWPIAGGMIRIGGLPVGRIAEPDLYRQIGYLPQELRFHPGSIQDNICNFQGNPDAAVQAATQAGVHNLIMALGDGYQTRLSRGQNTLPGGLLQKIGLARAICGNPSLLILDEPTNNLDAEGLGQLHDVVKSTCAAGGTAVILSQRRAAFTACDLILLLDDSKQTYLGPIDRSPAQDIQEISRIPAVMQAGASQ